MNNNIDLSALTSVIIDGIESSTFLFAESPLHDIPLPSEQDHLDWKSWQLNFSGEFLGNTTLILTREVGELAAANMLGIDSTSISDEVLNDAVGEILNMLTGQALVTIFGDIPVFDLTTPQTNSPFDDYDTTHCIKLLIEDCPLLFIVQLEA